MTINLEDNLIDSIPTSVKKMTSLRHLRLARNKISSMSDIQRLGSLQNLSLLTMSGNDVSSLKHFRMLTLFYVRTLDVLDAEHVSTEVLSQIFIMNIFIF